MSGALPFPMTDNRSFISDRTRAQGGSFLYSDTQDDQQKISAPKQHPYRPLVASSSRHAPPQHGPSYVDMFHDPARLHQDGSYGGPPDENSRNTVPVSQDYHHPQSYRDHYAQMNSSSLYSTADNSVMHNFPSMSHPGRPDLHPVASRSISSHSPSALTEQHSPAQDRSPALPRSISKRREKPRIELSPDQPLTTQGKPRARVYVACVQCRQRKIRCDGAKPICHNCSRRVSSNAEELTPCSYDPAPKRRGPDKNPGSRQRVSAQEITDGGKVRRRRRREAGPSDRAFPMAAHVSTPSTVATNGVLNPMLTQIQGPNALTSAEALTRAPAENRSNVFGKPDLYHGAQQQHGIAQTDTLNSNSSSHAASVRHISHHSDALQRIVTVNEPQFPQVPVHASPLQQYSPISTPLSDLTYVGYLPVPVSAISCVADEYDDDAERKPEIGAEPSLQFARETWWDTLLGLYSMQVQPQGGSASNYWFSFVNVPRFFARLMDPVTRSRLQPSLVLAAVAVANFIRSSEQENGEKGRTWALTLRDRAQSALEASLNARWVDESLVQASWLIAFFEISAHPLHSAVRVRSSLSMLDSLVRSLAMPSLDQDDHRASVFASHTVPTVVSSPSVSPPISPWNSRLPQPVSAARPSSPPGECACAAYTLGNNWSHAQELTPLWLMTPAWNRDSSDAEVRKEESRRVVWSAVTLVAGYTSYTSASNPLPTMDLFLMNAANYALLFPGESLVATSTGPSRKETVWALYMRTMLLWHTCIRMRSNTILGDPEKAQFAVSAWLEVDKIEEALNSHTCGIERAFLFQGREYLFNSRMCISYEFQRYIPQATANSNLLFHRKKAEEWLTHQASVAKRTMYGLQTITGQPNVSLARRPFFIFWFMSQVNRALLLWSCDNTLTIALDVSKALLGPIEYMMSMWPCPEQQKRYQDLRANLSNACYLAGVPPPSPMNVSSHLPRS